MANQQMLKQAQALQRKLAKAQEEMASKEVTGSAGGGTVTAVMRGDGTLMRVEIDPEAVDPEEVELLQDMVVAAVNEALRAAKELETQMMGGLAGGLGLPPGLI